MFKKRHRNISLTFLGPLIEKKSLNNQLLYRYISKHNVALSKKQYMKLI